MGRKKKGSFQHISNAQPASGTASDALYSFKVDYVAIGNKLRAQPVSYTHLDVDKRQRYRRGRILL